MMFDVFVKSYSGSRGRKNRIMGKNQEQANKPFKNKSFFHMGSISLTYI